MSTILCLIPALLLTLLPLTSSTGGIFQLKLLCSPVSPQGVSPCPPTIHVCIKNYQINIDNTNCYIGQTWANLTQSQEIALNFDFKFRWPGTFSLIIETFRDNSIIDRVATQQWLEIGTKWKSEVYNGTNTLNYSYRAVCLKNYYGKDCSKYCKSRDDKFGHYYCEENGNIVCITGWEGDYCEKASCSPTCSSVHGYCTSPNTCICHSGWTGQDCTQCKQYPGCKNGRCTKQWECECYEGWGGLFCNQDLNYCTNHKPCKNNGVCFNTGQGSYTCECASGWVGIDCGVRGVDSDTPCQGKNCTQYIVTQPNETLPPDPSIPDLCTLHPCANGGTCINQLKSFICKCPPPFSGPDCSCSCANNATCDTNSNCICQLGYFGTKCEQTEANFTLGMIKQIISNEEELTNEHVIFIIISSISIPFLVLFSVAVIFVMRKRRFIELERNEKIAKEQNEINTINNINKIKDAFMSNNIYKQNMNENLERNERWKRNWSYQPDDSGGSDQTASLKFGGVGTDV